jgi:endoglucanase
MTFNLQDTLKQLTEAAGPSGQESELRELILAMISPLVDEARTDALGNVIARKRGSDGSPGSIMLAAHMDEIGLMVTKLDKGFIRFTSVGGVDPGVLPSQAVVVHGRRPLPGMIASRPPHVLPASERKKPIPVDKLFIDVGLPPEELDDLVQVGDFITFQQETVLLNDKYATGKALDNRTSVTAVLAALHYLQAISHSWDVYAVTTVQEEVGLRGAMASTFQINPDIGIALDTTFAEQPGLNSEETVAWDKGPAIGLGPNIHPKIHARLVDTAKTHEIPFIVEVLPGNSGTDAWAMQVTRAGIPTGLLSIPIRNMHTPVETVVLKDIDRTARLLAAFIGELDQDTLETLRLE